MTFLILINLVSTRAPLFWTPRGAKRGEEVFQELGRLDFEERAT
jgi:hypothetical protein